MKNSGFWVRLETKRNILAFADVLVLITENKEDPKQLKEILDEEAGYK